MSKVAFSYNSVNRTRELNKGLNGKVKLGDEKNTGSTAKYLGGKFLAGVTGTAEGIADLAVGSIYSLTGRKERAKSLFANNITGQRMEELDEAYNPGKLASFAGDVSTGLGQTSLALLSSLVLGPVGAAAGMSSAAASTLSLIPIGLGAAGAGVGEASQKTGELGFREYGYGLASGVTEMLLERYLGAVGSLGTKAISNGVANTAVGKLADSAVGLVARNAVVKGMVSSSLEEGLEEGVATIAGTLLERVWKVDPEAKVNLGEVLYSSLVGGLSGGMIGAGMSTLNVARNEVRGNAIREGGKTEAILNTAADVSVRLTKMSAAKKSSSARMYATEIDRLAKQYNALSEDAKSGKKGAQILGALESAMISAEMATTISLQKSDILEALRGGDAAQIESYVGYAKVLTGDNSLTAQDLITNKNGSADLLSVSVWARDFVTPSEALSNAVEIDRLVREQAGQEIPEEEFKAIGELKTDEFKVYGNRIALREADGYTVADIVQDKETGEHTRYEGARRFETAEEAERYIRGDEEVSPVAEASQEAPAAAEEAQKEPETPAEAEKTEEPKQEAKAEAAPEKEKAPAAKKEKVAGEEAAARKHIKDFDSLSASRRRAVLAFERQAIESKLDETTRKAIARIVAVRSGLQVVFDARVPAKLNGFWNGNLSGGKRVIVLRPQDAKAVSRVFLHEMVHDMAKVQPKAYAMLGKEALKLATDDFVKQIEDAYTAYYSETYDRAPTQEEIAEEVVAHVLQSRIDQTAFANRFANNSAIQRGGRFLKGLLSKLKKTDAKGKEIAEGERLLAKFEKALRQYAEGAKVLERVGVTEKAVTEAVGKNAKKDNAKAVSFSLNGKNDYGIEVYETSPETMKLSWAERKAKYLELMGDAFRKRTAKFERNGHTYYAEFDQSSLRKPIYGDSRSSPNGTKALIKAGADGDVFYLVENSKYRKSKPNIKDHTDADYFDYFVKTVQIDGKVFDLVADVEKKYGEDGGYVYTLALTDNKKIKASPTHGTPINGPVQNVGNTSGDIVSQNPEKSTPSGKKSSKASVDISKYGKGAKDKYKIQEIRKSYQEKMSDAQSEIKSLKKELSSVYRIKNKITQIREFAKHKSGYSSDLLVPEDVTALAELLGKVESRNRLNAQNVKSVADLLATMLETKIGTVTRDEDGTPHWYLGGVEQETAPMDVVVAAEQYFSPQIRDYIKDLQTIEGDTLRADQVKDLYWVLSATDKFLHNVGTYKALNGDRIGAKERALRGIEQIEKAAELNPEGKFARAVRLIKWIMSGYLDPQSVYSMFDGFAPDGVMTELYELVRRGEELAKNREERMLEGLREFMHEHKGYENRLNEGGVYLNGKEISRGAAIEIYELSKREQAKLGLEESAITVPKLGEPRKDGTRRVVSGTDTVTIREGTFDNAVAELYSQFDEADRAFIEQIEAFYKESTGIKRKADLDIRGYTNVIEGHYYPIHRDRMTIATRITNAKLAGQEINVYNVPFNKNTKKGARNALHVGNPFTEAQYHASLLGVYENLYEPLMAFDMVYNANVGSTTDVRTVRKAVNRTTADFTEKGDFADKYISKHLADVQRGGKAMTDDNFFDALISSLRGNFAVYALGLNLGTILKQTSSYASAFSILSAPAMSRGLAHPVNFEDMDTYSRITYARAADHGLTKAESLTDKVSKFQEMTTKGIEWMDRQVLGRLWNACLEQAEIDGYSKTSEEGKTYAGELLDKIIRETQSNSYVSGKSSMMRGNELVKALTMFTGEQVKQASRVWQRAATVAAWKKFGDKRSELGITEEQYAEAKKSLAKSITALLASTAMFVAIGQLMKTLFRQKRRDKNGEEITALQDASMEVTSNLLGMVPLMSDIYDTLARGYDIGGNFFGDALAITADSVSEMGALMKKLMSGESVDDADIGAPIRKTLYALGQVTGIPLRNVYNLSHGVVSMFSKTGGYWLDSKFYHQPYMEDFKKAVAKGDEKMARYLADVIVKSGYGNLSDAEIAELLALYAEGYSGAIPSELTNRVSVDGETVTLTKEQHKKYLASSQQAGVVVSKLLSSDSFKALDGEAKESALRAVYSAYKTKAKVDALGKGGNRLTALSQFHDFDELAAYSAIAKTYTSDDEDVRGGKTKSQKVKEFLRSLGFDEGDREYYILLMACGITSKAIRTNVAKTISAYSLSKEEKIKTAEELGYEVKNGKIQIS